MLRELREFGEPRSSDWGTSEILLLRGDEASEREEREVVVAAEAELPGRLEGMRRRGETREEDMGRWDGRAETRKGKQERNYKGIEWCRRSLSCIVTNRQVSCV